MFSFGDFTNTVSYEYVTKSEEKLTDYYVSKYITSINESTANEYGYSYDSYGNITAITLNGSQI